eukprot:3048858-Pyramimonas_sp.AAC.1
MCLQHLLATHCKWGASWARKPSRMQGPVCLRLLVALQRSLIIVGRTLLCWRCHHPGAITAQAEFMNEYLRIARVRLHGDPALGGDVAVDVKYEPIQDRRVLVVLRVWTEKR